MLSSVKNTGVDSRTDENENRAMPRLIFGTGTGRCGTWSLFRLLQAQKGVAAMHEGFYLPFDPNILRFWLLLYRAMTGCRNTRCIATVSFVWINYMSEIMSHILNPKVICLKRPREETVESWMIHQPELNLLTDLKSKHWDDKYEYLEKQGDQWPKFDLPKKEAHGAYWDYVYDAADYWEKKFPDNFRIFETNDLNSHEGVKSMLDFAEIPEKNQVVHVGVKLNTKENHRGLIDVQRNSACS